MKVKCIDASNSSILVIDYIYDVVGDHGQYYDIHTLKYGDVPFHKIRFEVVVDKQVTFNPCQEIKIAITQSSSSKIDLEEENCWKKMRPTVLSHECVCGIARVDCWIHKDN